MVRAWTTGWFSGESSPAEKIIIVFFDVLDGLMGGRVGVMIGWFGADEWVRFWVGAGMIGAGSMRAKRMRAGRTGSL